MIGAHYNTTRRPAPLSDTRASPKQPLTGHKRRTICAWMSGGRHYLCQPAAVICAGFMLFACRPALDTLHNSQLYITSTPADATLIYDDVNIGQTPATIMEVTPGEHLLVLRKPGFREARKTVSTKAGERQSAEFKLEALTGLLLITSKPSDADIVMDEASVGKAPLYLHDASFGQHRIAARAPGYLSRIVNVTVSDRIPQKIEINLTSDSAQLQVTSTPTGAVITIDSAAAGKTPQNFQAITSGKHSIEISLPGYIPYRGEINAQAGEMRAINPILTPLPGTLTVLSSPPGARIYLNEQFKANAPFSTNIPATRYVIRAEAKGYDQQVCTNSVVFGAESVAEFNLVKSSGTILLSTEPPGINVYLDGDFKGTTLGQPRNPISEQLSIDFVPRGKRKLQFTRQGYYDITRTQEIQPKQTVILHEKLRLRPIPFVPDVIVKTGVNAEDIFRGIIRERFENGGIYLEVEPGIFKTFSPAEVLSIETITNTVTP